MGPVPGYVYCNAMALLLSPNALSLALASPPLAHPTVWRGGGMRPEA